MTAPLIGLTPYQFLNKYGYPQTGIGNTYIQAVARAGGLPVVLPLDLDESQLAGLAARLDGIIFTGGGDIEPARYGHASHPLVEGVDPVRDQAEYFLLDTLLPQGTPILGICRGFQLINVKLGGALYEDILDQRPPALQHQSPPELARDLTPHTVEVTQGSRLAAIMGQTGQVPVNSLHHQGAQDLGQGLQPSAYAPDGLVEAIEHPGHPFLLAVQWHPECLPNHPPMQALFRALVEAASR